MVRRWFRGVLLVGACLALDAHGAHAAPAPPPVIDVGDTSTGLIPVPAGCPSPAPADLAFVGTVLDKDEFIDKGTVRFQIDQLRAGSAGRFAVDGVIDVRYGPDSQYLEVESQYLVAAAVDADIGVLASKVSPEQLLFGGNAVIGLEDTEVVCPVIDDPVQTINLDGTPLEAGLFTPFFEDKRVLLATIGVPAGVVALALVGLVLLRRVLDVGFRGVVLLGRSAVTPTRDHRAAQVRHHAGPAEADYTDWTVDDAGDVDLVDA